MRVVQTKVKPGQHCLYTELNSLNIGDVLIFDIFIKKSNDYVIIIEAGTVLSDSLHKKLQKQDNLYILIKDKSKLELTSKNLKFYTMHNRNNLKKRVEFICIVNSRLFNDFLSNDDDKIDMNGVILLLKSIIYLIKYDENFLKNTIPNFTNEHSIPNHSLHLAIYSMSIANRLNMKSKQLLQLGIAAILHDVGYKKIDMGLLIKESTLEDSEIKKIQKHTLYSVDILKKNKITDPVIIDAVLHHHEQYDGGGYPNKLNSRTISPFAAILFICDVFDALTSDKSYRKKYTSFEAIKMMLKDPTMVGKFNRQYLQTLLKLI